jgi:hypothetical protein
VKKIFKDLILTMVIVMLSNQLVFCCGISRSIPKSSGAIDVTQSPYNVPNDRTGNASTGIQQALHDYGGSTPIWIPAGQYRLADRINITKNNTKLYMHRNAKMYRAHTSFGMIHAYNKNNVLIKGGHFDRNDQNAKRVIYFNGGSGNTIDDVYVGSYKGWCFAVYGNDSGVYNSTIRGSSGAIGDDGIHFIGGNGFTVDNCDVLSCDDGVGLFPDAREGDVNIQNVTIKNSKLVSTDCAAFGLGIHPKMSHKGGIVADVYFKNIIGSTSSSTPDTPGIKALNYSSQGGIVENIQILNCSINGHAGNDLGLKIRGGNGGYLNGVIVTDTDLTSFNVRALDIRSAAGSPRHQNIEIRDCTFRNNAYIEKPSGWTWLGNTVSGPITWKSSDDSPRGRR